MMSREVAAISCHIPSSHDANNLFQGATHHCAWQPADRDAVRTLVHGEAVASDGEESAARATALSWPHAADNREKLDLQDRAICVSCGTNPQCWDSAARLASGYNRTKRVRVTLHPKRALQMQRHLEQLPCCVARKQTALNRI